MFPERTGLIVWVNDLKAVKHLERFGSIHYSSKRMHYVVIYMNADKVDDAVKAMQKYPFVKKVERSMRSEIRTEYNSNVPDKSKLYT
ncbi:YlbG family protein [Paenibacillus koleovorans]|uniref:YlbG family protein n=1 Tax=Paenibacillus koleovorans TaxID=121608 RepID=UPI000FDB5326|nr:YlbG family protein [Paenibacillus koleovorans]